MHCMQSVGNSPSLVKVNGFSRSCNCSTYPLTRGDNSMTQVAGELCGCDDGACDCDACLLGISDKFTNDDSKPKLPQIVSWSKLRSIMRITLFAVKNSTKEWTQLGGHKGGFCHGTQSDSILKQLSFNESECMQQLMSDILRPFVPQFRGQISMDNQVYLEMQDLLCEFRAPALMDCKIGTRTYLEKELDKAREDPELRNDLYKKMVEVDVNAPTAEEHSSKGVTKVRYMQWRESISSTCELSFRIEGIKNGSMVHMPNYFKTVRTAEQVKENLRQFVGTRRDVIQRYIERMRQMKQALESSPFFAIHEFIGSSLLFVHDDSGKASIWMIDFAKTRKLPNGFKITHRAEWQEGNHEDGYLTGFENLMGLMAELLLECDTAAAT